MRSYLPVVSVATLRLDRAVAGPQRCLGRL